MAKKCEPVYKNLNLIQSFSEQRYVTVQLLQQACMNDEWLKQSVEKLNYLSPPAVRKGMPISEVLDIVNSYGAALNGSKQLCFDNKMQDEITIDFDENFDKVDQAKSNDVSFITYTPEYDDDGNVTNDIDDQYHRCECPTEVETRVTPAAYDSFGTTNGGGVNSFWYIGWDKSKPYYVRPDWLANWRDYEIPAVCRAQTFKAEASGTLTSIDLKLNWTGSKGTDCGSPLYIQIWNTYKRFVEKTEYDRKKSKMVKVFIKYANIPKKANASAAQIKRGFYQEHYANYQKYEKYDKKLKYQEGKKKGEYKKDKKGNIITEEAYRKKDNGAYVVKREYVQWLGHNKKKGVDKNGKTVYRPNIYHPLAEAVLTTVGEPFPTIRFDKPCTLKKGQSYAIVLFSPLSEWKHCPMIGGWGRNCKRDNKYADGNAFLSEDNGRTWIRYGKNGVDVDPDGKALDYKVGKLTPQDFAFRCNVETTAHSETTDDVYDIDNEHILYAKPILTNPITSIIVAPQDYGSETSETDVNIDYEISTDGDAWIPVNPTEKLYLDSPSTVLLLRARLKSNVKSKTPYIEHIKLYLECNPATELYARTSFYKPRDEPMLDASVWGRVYAPFTMDEKVSCTAEIIQGKTDTAHFKFIEVEELEDAYNSLDMDTGDISNLSDLNKAIYLTTNFNVLETLKENEIYVKPYQDTSNLYLLSFSQSYNEEDMIIPKSDSESDYYDDYTVGGLTFPNIVAYPVLKCRMQPPENEDESSEDVYLEWLDYTFDYENNKLIFKKDTLDNLISGDFYVTYNPVFIEGLTADEIGLHLDNDTGLQSEGLVLDYFKETFTIGDEEIATRRIKLRVQPVDPIREVKLIDLESEEETYLVENIDYTVDLYNNELIFKINNIDGVSSVLEIGKALQVVYTPNLEDNQLAIGYYAKREDTSKQVYIEDAFFEYKV